MTTLLRRTPRQRRAHARARYEDHVEQYEERTGRIEEDVWFEGDPLYPVSLSGPITVTLPAVPRSDETITVSTVRSEADERRQAALEQKFGITPEPQINVPGIGDVPLSTLVEFNVRDGAITPEQGADLLAANGIPVGPIDVTETSS